MAEAFAQNGHVVRVVTNEYPLVARECSDFPNHSNVEVVVSTSFSGWEGEPWDVIVLVPDLSPTADVFRAALAARAATMAPIIFLDFEAPGWFNSVNSNNPHPWYRTFAWKLASRHAHLIVSSTAVGSTHARHDYGPLAGEEGFVVCHPPINDRALPSEEVARLDQAVVITRKDRATSHKGASILPKLVTWLPAGYSVVVLGSIDDGTRDAVVENSVGRDITVEYLAGVSDAEKFRMISASRLMVFASRFEGFGLPPVEAACCGTPCVATRLPVLEETLGWGAVTFVEQDDETALAEKVREIAAAPGACLSKQAVEKARALYGFAGYCARLEDLLRNSLPAAVPNARRMELVLLSYALAVWSKAVNLSRRAL